MTVEEAKKQAFILNMIAEILVQQAEEIEALQTILSPPALLPIAEQPVREVTGIQLEDDHE